MLPVTQRPTARAVSFYDPLYACVSDHGLKFFAAKLEKAAKEQKRPESRSGVAHREPQRSMSRFLERRPDIKPLIVDCPASLHPLELHGGKPAT